MSVPNGDPFLPENIVATLVSLPKQLQDNDNAIAQAQTTLDELKESLDLEIVNASLNANADGKNAEARKMQTDKAIAESQEVKAAKSAWLGGKSRLESLQAENKQMSRSFAAMCHIAELKAAQMILMSKGQEKR
jgi:hypothetical protein